MRKTNIAFRLFLVIAMVAGAIGSMIPMKAFAIAVPTTPPTILVTPSTAGASAEYNFNFVHTAAAPLGSTITVLFPTGTVLPATIAKSSWLFGDGAGTAAANTAKAQAGTAAPDVVVDPANRTIQVPVIDPVAALNDVAITFTQGAGIRNRTTTSTAGSFTFTSSAEPLAPLTATFPFTRLVTYTPSTTTQGGTVTVSGVGFTPGQTASLTSGGAVTSSAIVAADGSVTFTATRSGTAGGVPTVTDGAGLTTAAVTALAVGLLPDLTVIAGATPNLTDTITVDGRNYPVGSVISIGYAVGTGIGPGGTYGGVAIAAANWVSAIGLGVDGVLGTADDTVVALTDRDTDLAADDFRITMRAPSTAALGAAPTSGVTTVTVQSRTTGGGGLYNDLVLLVADDVTGGTGSATVTTNPRTVTLSPNNGPSGTLVTVTGTGFPKNSAAAVTHLIGIATGGAAASPADGIPTDSTGAFTTTFTIPAATATGARTVTVTIPSTVGDGLAVTGFASFTVGSPATLVVSPNNGPRGTQVSVSGTGWTVANGAAIGASGCAIAGLAAAGGLTVGGIAPTGDAAICTNADGSLVSTTRTIPAASAYGATSFSGTSGTITSVTSAFTVTQPTLTMSPAAGTVGTTLQFSGAGWLANSIVTITQVGTGVIASAQVSATGTVNTSFQLPTSAYIAGGGGGPINFTAADTGGNGSGVQIFTLAAAAASVSPTTVGGGGTTTLTGTGFPAGFAVNVTFDGAAFPLGTPVFTTAVGAIPSTVITLPVLTGPHTLGITVNGVTQSANITLTNLAGGAGVPVAAATAFTAFPTGRLQIANVLSADGAKFAAFVPGLPGNDAALAVQPNSVIILTVNANTTVVVSGVSFSLLANTPRFIPVGNNVTITIA